VVPVTQPPVADGCVAVEGDRILWVGPYSSAPEGQVEDLGDGVLLPGLVNAHTHLELSHLGHLRAVAKKGFLGWMEAVVSARDAPPPGVRAGAGDAIAGLVGSGTAAVGDVSNTLAHLDLLEDSGLDAVVFFELLGWDPARADAVLASADRRLAEVAGRRTRVRLAGHAPHSVSRRLFEGLAMRGGPASVHLAESPAETRFLASGDGEWPEFLARRGLGHVAFEPPVLSPVQYLDSLGVLTPGLLAVHCVQTAPDDWRLLASRGVRVALCPRSNRNLGLGLPPVKGLLEAGVGLCLGTDSLGSAESLNVLDDAALLHRELPGLDPALLVRLATAGGAEALGLSDLGTLAPGKRAVLAFAPGAPQLSDPLGFLLSGDAHTVGVRPS
jgi:cytosine/adenosine deaminase-related metal-dependent hydrolase